MPAGNKKTPTNTPVKVKLSVAQLQEMVKKQGLLINKLGNELKEKDEIINYAKNNKILITYLCFHRHIDKYAIFIHWIFN